MDPSFLELFEKYKTSQNAALVCGDTALTYEQLYNRSLALAHNLRERGVGLVSTAPESYDIFDPKAAEHSPWVVIVSERSVDAVIGVIAAWMAGGAFVLVDSDAPDAYIDGILEDTAAAAVLRNGDFVSLRDDAGLSYTFPQENEIACAVFTSGSTGKPKGAVLEHRTINGIIQWQTEYMKPSGWTATAAYAPFGFIAAIWELFFPLANGLTLHILDENTRHDLFKLESYTETHRVSYVFLPPNVAEVFTQMYKGDSLNYLRVAGGRLRSCGDPAGRYEIMYHLGMSENGGSVTFKPIREAMSGDIPIGKPWNKTKVYLLGETDEINKPGEAAVSGPSLFRGYLSRREETLSKRVKNPYSNEPGYEMLYLSGDLARSDENGEFFHMGRNDWNVEIRDMKVNPMQVESVLGECASVTDCCVTVKTLNGESALIGWVAGNSDEASLRMELAERLPEYMIPSVFIILDKMPRNLSGKIDRATLVYTPPHEMTDAALDRSSPTYGTAALFARVLGRPAGEDDNFLSLGGDSLKFMRLQIEITREYSVNIPYTVLFANPTPRMLTEVLQKQEKYVPIPPAPPMDAYPISGPMRQMWMLWRTGQDRGKYFVTAKCRFTGEIDKLQVKACFEELVRRISILRSRFAEREGDVFQMIEESAEVLIGGEPRREFDLSATPLFDVSLKENTLTLRTHHIITDAMGMRALAVDFWTLYDGGEPRKSAQVTDVTMWSLGRERGTDEKYWRELFSGGVPLLELPCDFPRSARLQSSSTETVFWNANEAEKLRERASSRGATLFQMFLAAYAMLLSKLSGESSVVIGVPFAGRDHPDMARSVGMFVRTLPVKLDVSGMNLEDALEHTRERFLAVRERQDISLERLTKIIDCRRVAYRGPFYDVMINYIPLPVPLPDASGLHPEILRRDGYPGALFDLVLDMREEKDGVSAVFNYADSLFLPETIKKWARMFKDLLFSPEDILLDVWKDILGAEGEDFFTAGGTSLAAIRMESALFEKGWLLSAADIFQNPRFSEMTALMTPADEIDWEAEA